MKGQQRKQLDLEEERNRMLLGITDLSKIAAVAAPNEVWQVEGVKPDIAVLAYNREDAVKRIEELLEPDHVARIKELLGIEHLGSKAIRIR